MPRADPNYAPSPCLTTFAVPVWNEAREVYMRGGILQAKVTPVPRTLHGFTYF